jgi:hypothetical protein
MTTLTLHAPMPRRKFGGFGRLIRKTLTVLDVFAEAQQMADEAYRRFHFGRG